MGKLRRWALQQQDADSHQRDASAALMHAFRSYRLCDEGSDLSLKLAEHVHEKAVTAIADIGELIRIIGEVVAGADFQVIADVAIATQQETDAGIVGLANRQSSYLDHGVPLARQ